MEHVCQGIWSASQCLKGCVVSFSSTAFSRTPALSPSHATTRKLRAHHIDCARKLHVPSASSTLALSLSLSPLSPSDSYLQFLVELLQAQALCGLGGRHALWSCICTDGQHSQAKSPGSHSRAECHVIIRTALAQVDFIELIVGSKQKKVEMLTLKFRCLGEVSRDKGPVSSKRWWVRPQPSSRFGSLSDHGSARPQHEPQPINCTRLQHV